MTRPDSAPRTGCGCSVELRGGNADAYDIGAVDDALFAFRVDRKGPLLCAADAPGLADAIMADLSGVR